jgi:3-hydroxyisobutyrate dehydrogenase
MPEKENTPVFRKENTMKVALFGTGLLGFPLGERILDMNHQLVVFNRTQEKAEPLKALGAEIAEHPHDALRSAECIILMLADAQAIREVLLSPRSRRVLSGRTVIQMGTISPTESIAFNAEVLNAGGDYFEAPVLGSVTEAKEGTLILMVGASSEQFERWSSFLTYFGPDPLLIGPVGHASTLKLALNQLIGALTASFALSLGFVQRRGINVELFLKILRGSPLYAPIYDRKLERMLTRNHANPSFFTQNLSKDIDLFLAEAKSMNMETAGLEGIRRLVAIAVDKGYAEQDYSCLLDIANPKEE